MYHKFFIKSSYILLFFCITLRATEKELTNSFTKKWMVGALTGGVTTLTVEPLIYVKNTWQQNRKISSNPKIFYRGLFVNGMGFIPSMAIQNSVFGQTKEILAKRDLSPLSINLCAALAAGITSTPISSLRELIIIQQQNNGGNFYKVSKNFVQLHGWQKLFRGSIPIAIRNSSFASFFFIATPKFQEILERNTDNAVILKLFPAMTAGIISSIITHPLDTLKTNMQSNINSKSIIKTALEMFYENDKKNFFVFYRGLLPRTTSIAIAMALEYNLRQCFTKLLS